MITKKISNGIMHSIPIDISNVLKNSPSIFLLWESLTPLARNEWICWVESAKKIETRNTRISRMIEDLLHGKRRPCCWPGCPHR